MRTKKKYCSKLILLQLFYCLGWNILLTSVVCLIIETLLSFIFIISIHEWSYSFIYSFIARVISLYQFNYCFLMSSQICKEQREYKILHQTTQSVLLLLKLLLKDYWKITYFFSKTFSEFFIRGRSTNPVTFEMKPFATIVYSYEIWIWMLHVAGLVIRPLFIWFRCFIAVQLLIHGLRSLKVTTNLLQIYFIKIFSMN